jgi:hypothetical protein
MGVNQHFKQMYDKQREYEDAMTNSQRSYL